MKINSDNQSHFNVPATIELPLSYESLIAQRDSLAQAIAFLAMKAGIATPKVPLSGSQIMMLASDLRNAASNIANAEAIGVEKLAARRRSAAKVAMDNCDQITALSLESEAARAEMFAKELREGQV